jgi:hypothetical protein
MPGTRPGMTVESVIQSDRNRLQMRDGLFSFMYLLVM